MSFIEERCRDARWRLQLAATLSIFVLLGTTAWADDTTPTVGLDLGNGRDVVVIDGVQVDVQEQGTAGAIGVVAGRGHDQITNIGDISVTATATGDSTSDPVSASATGLTSDEADLGHGVPRGDGFAFGRRHIPPGLQFPHGLGNAKKNSGNTTEHANKGKEENPPDSQGLVLGPIQAPPTSRYLPGLGLGPWVNAAHILVNRLLNLSLPGRGHFAPWKGHGGELVHNSGAIEVTANAEIANGMAGVTATAVATGIETGKGKDVIINDGSIDVTANASASLSDFTLNLVGTDSEDASSIVRAVATGINSGGGPDWIENTGPLSVNATAEISALNFNLNVIDAASADASLTAEAIAAGIVGTSGNDAIFNSDVINIGADAQGTSTGIELNLVDAGGGDISTGTVAAVTGIAGGRGNDLIDNSGSITATSHADTHVVGVNLSIADFTIFAGAGSSGATSEATATGLDGGEQNDHLVNTGNVAATATAESHSVSVGVASIGIPQGISSFVSGTLADAGTTAEADAIGFAAGDGNDIVFNAGTFSADANATADQVGVAVSVPIPKLPDPVALALSFIPGFTIAGAGTDAEAHVTGITGGKGHDMISNAGAMTATATADTDAVGVSVDLPDLLSNSELPNLTLATVVSDTSANSRAFATGIDGGTDHDWIVNLDTGTLFVGATADADSTSVAVSLSGISTDPGLVVNVPVARSDTMASAAATGIIGGNGHDAVNNDGEVEASATGTATSVSVAGEVQGADPGLAVGVALVQARSQASTHSSGITGDDGKDALVSSNLVKSQAHSTVIAGSGGLAGGGAGKGVSLEGAGADGSATGDATAVGMSGNNDTDWLRNDGTVDVLAQADTTSISVAASGNGTGTGAAVGIGLARATSEAETDSTGMAGGDGRDALTNSGLVKSQAISSVISGSGALAGGGTGTGLTVEGAVADGSSIGRATSMGMSGGSDRDGIRNDGTVDVLAQADTTSVSVAVSGNGTGTGASIGVGLARATSEAHTNSTGIAGGDSNDDLTNTGLAKSQALSTVIAGSGAAAGGGTGTGVTFEGAGADGSATGSAVAAGISGGGYGDRIRNSGTVDVLADTDTTSVSVAVSGNGTGTGVAIGVAAARAVSEGDSESTGISGGTGADAIVNSNMVKSHALTTTTAVSVSAAVGGVGTGVAVQGAGADAQTIGTASAVGINGDEGPDYIRNAGTVDTLAHADTTSVSVAVSGSGAGTGVGAGLTLVRADTDAIANSTGIALGLRGDDTHPHPTMRYHDDPAGHDYDDRDGHHGDDRDDGHGKDQGGAEWVFNSGAVLANSIAEANSTSVSVQLGITGTGLQAGGALANARTMANGDATGIEGSEYRDVIVNHGTITADSDVDAVATSVGVSFNVSLEGATLGAAVTDATTDAYAWSTGIFGDQGDDWLSNRGSITAHSDAFARATSVAVSAGIAFVPLNAAVADSTARAWATSIGMDGGDGNDRIDSNLDAPGTIITDAVSTAKGVSVAVAPVGAALGTADVFSQATAIGIDGGIGDDAVIQNSDLSGIATADATGTTVNVTLIGAAGTLLERATTTGIAQGTGIASGDGADYIGNLGTIDAQGTTTVTGTTVSVAPIGFGLAGTTTTTTAGATGIDSGADDDTVHNEGTISGLASASGKAVSVSAGFAGFLKSDAASTVTGKSVGIDLGDGNDVVLNEADIDTAANGLATAISGAGTFAGLAKADASSTANATAIGIDGGSGQDEIANQAAITAAAGNALTAHGFANCASQDAAGGACAKSRSISLTLAGVASADASSTAIASAMGIDGGLGDDAIETHGALTATALARGDASSVTVGLFGAASAAATATANATAIGIDGGADHDLIGIESAVAATSVSETRASGTSVQIFGASSSNADTITNADAFGVQGGSGDDTIFNGKLGSISASATSNSQANSSSWTFAGGASSLATLGSLTRSTGIAGGGGNDRIFSRGPIDVDTQANLSTSSSGKAIFGNAKAGTQIAADALAIGIDGGDGDDRIKTASLMDVYSSANLTSNATSVTFAGSSGTSDLLAAVANATGVDGGTGQNGIRNDGVITVGATASLTATGGAKSTFGGASSVATVTGQAAGAGFLTGDMNDALVIAGDVSVTANANPTSNSGANSGPFFVDAVTRSFAASRLAAEGANVGAGENFVLNGGNLGVSMGGTSNAIAASDIGILIGLDADARAVADSRIEAATATGILSGNGDDLIRNKNGLTVAAAPIASASATGDADDPGISNDGTADATAQANGVQAFGIAAGDGHNGVWNAGDISVESHPQATAVANAYGDLGDATARATARANNALAIGVQTESDNDLVLNNGRIDVTARPEASSSAFAEEDAGDLADEEARATSTATARAVGVDTGAGHDVVVNNGAITVTARATATASAETEDDDTEVASRTEMADAVGIWTGAGDDFVVNNGSIATTAVAATSHSTLAIGTDTGNDVVKLNDGSSVAGAIDLGLGDDTLWLSGTPVVNGPITTGGGVDSVVFDGSGSFANPLAGFQIAVKQGGGTFTVPTLPTMQRLELYDGTLHVDGSYQMAATGVFNTTVNGDGSFGQLQVGGTATLDGGLEVVKGASPFLDGTSYDVVSATLVNGAFASETLPAPTPLLSFDVAQHPNSVTVTANVASFTTVAAGGNRVQQAVAQHLDNILSTAKGDISAMLASFQAMPDGSDFGSAFASLSPDTYDNYTAGTLAMVQRHNDTAHDRMATLRAANGPRGADSGTKFLPGSQPIFFTTTDRQFAPDRARFGPWVANFNLNGTQSTMSSGHQGFEYEGEGFVAGMDYPVGERSFLGTSFAWTRTDVGVDGSLAGGDIEGRFSSLYGTYFLNDDTYLESVLTYGRSSYQGSRSVYAGRSQGLTSSTHDGDVLSAFVESGRAFATGEWRSEIFGSMQYTSVQEESFREKGLGNVDLIVDARRTNSLQSELGWRVGRSVDFDEGTLTPQFGVSWLHDFDVEDRTITARFSGAPERPFSVPGRDSGGDGVRVTGGLDFVRGDRMSLSTRVGADLYQERADLSGRIEFHLRF